LAERLLKGGRPVAENGRKNVDDSLVFALATGLSVLTAAQRAGVSERTVYRRLDDPVFRQRISETRTGLFAEAVGRLAGLAGKAADALGELLTSERDLVKLQAAKGVLDLGPKLREAGELAERLDALERLVAGRDEDPDEPESGVEDEGSGTEVPPEEELGAGI
jgi:hypothetical protein